MRNYTALLPLLLFFLLSGCASIQQYEGEKLPPSKVAHVYMVKSDGLVAGKIDGKRRGFGNIQEFYLLPGSHTINVFYISANQQSWGSISTGRPLLLQFEAEAGKEYRIKRLIDFRNHRWITWIEEESNGIRVSTIIKDDDLKNHGVKKSRGQI